MKLVQIPKKSGGTRTICAPDKQLKYELRELLCNNLNAKQLQYCDLEICHGFIPGRSIVTNARFHLGYNFTLSFDIKDFFDSVTPDHVKDYLSQEEIDKCFINGRAYQGLPTSPAVANIAAIKMDVEIKNLIGNRNIIFTRYADDISISFNEYNICDEFKTQIPLVAAKHRFQINPKKTRLQDARYGKREITGVYVDDKGISVSRKFKRILRAAKHKGSIAVEGLEEFSKLKMPHPLPQIQLDNLYKTATYKHQKAKFVDHNSTIYKSTITRTENYKKDKRANRKDFVKECVKTELRIGVIKKEELIRVSKINS